MRVVGSRNIAAKPSQICATPTQRNASLVTTLPRARNRAMAVALSHLNWI
jgi:hypothetical protein